MISSIQGSTDKEITHEMDKIYTNLVLYEMIQSLANAEIIENDLKSFKEFLDENMDNEAITSVVYGYDMDLNIYASGPDVRKLNPSSLMGDLQSMTGAGVGGMSMGMDIWGEMMKGKKGEYVKELEKAKKSGYVRVRVDGSIYDLSEEIKHSCKVCCKFNILENGPKKYPDKVTNEIN